MTALSGGRLRMRSVYGHARVHTRGDAARPAVARARRVVVCLTHKTRSNQAMTSCLRPERACVQQHAPIKAPKACNRLLRSSIRALYCTPRSKYVLADVMLV